MKSSEGVEIRWPTLMLSVGVALLLWLFLAAEREGSVWISAPVDYAGLPAGLQLAGTPPARVEVEVLGPRIRLLGLRRDAVRMRIDLAESGPGRMTFRDLGRFVKPGPELKAVRTVPPAIELAVAGALPR